MSLPMRSEVSEVYGAFKRGVDILAGAAALLALAVLFPFLALAIKLGDRGPSSIGRRAWADMGGRSKS
jgi:lipopolysaccharide/colanic/teichoic acid biosynthesis glycosyltransferase